MTDQPTPRTEAEAVEALYEAFRTSRNNIHWSDLLNRHLPRIKSAIEAEAVAQARTEALDALAGAATPPPTEGDIMEDNGRTFRLTWVLYRQPDTEPGS